MVESEQFLIDQRLGAFQQQVNFSLGNNIKRKQVLLVEEVVGFKPLDAGVVESRSNLGHTRRHDCAEREAGRRLSWAGEGSEETRLRVEGRDHVPLKHLQKQGGAS